MTEIANARIVPITPTLAEIEAMFVHAGFRLWLVGGCVRDALMSVKAKDIDLTTDATPDEQIAIYLANDVRHEPTGLQHGTITVIRNGEVYEITTLRTDVETDGRHAKVLYTRDLLIDLERRDLTINAIAMGFDGEIVDPFGGREDLAAGRVRFVGEPELRMREDYLRILRWFRFLGRFWGGGEMKADRASCDAVKAEAKGLSRISVERIWLEMSRILTGPSAIQVLRLMRQLEVDDAIGLPQGYDSRLEIAVAHGMDAATTLGGYVADYLDEGSVDRLVIAWKLSNAEKHRARFVCARILDGKYTTEAAKFDLVKGENLRLVSDTLRLARNAAGVASIEAWDVPVFPVDTRDLLAAGMKQGLELGERLRAMKARWVASDYTLSADELVGMVPA